MDRGWDEVRPLQGGFDAWKASGAQVEPKADVPVRD
jgi:3-mercaptopyruvate sulfurtransferase SseA